MLKRHLTNMKQLLSQKGRAQTSGAEQVKDRKQLLAQLLRGELEPETAGLPERYYMVYFSIQRYQEIRKNFGNDFDKNFHVSLLNLAGQISQIANHGVIVPDHVTNLVMVYADRPPGQPGPGPGRPFACLPASAQCLEELYERGCIRSSEQPGPWAFCL